MGESFKEKFDAELEKKFDEMLDLFKNRSVDQLLDIVTDYANTINLVSYKPTPYEIVKVEQIKSKIDYILATIKK